MKREKWSQDTDLWNDLTEPTSEEHTEEYSLEDILLEFSGEWDSYAEEPGATGIETLSKNTDENEADDMEIEAVLTAETTSDLFGEDISTLAKDTKQTGGREKPGNSKSTSNFEKVSQTVESEESLALDGDGDTEERATQKSSRKHSKKERMAVEDFPDWPPEKKPVGEDSVDYTDLFRMFADPESASSKTETEKTHDQSKYGYDLQKTEYRSEKESAETRPVHMHEEAPLFAEQSPDFKDILREFMLGDQHPIYADMPGIGKKADDMATSIDDLSDLDAMINSVIPKASSKPELKETKSKNEPRLEKEDASAITESEQPEPAVPESASRRKTKRKLGLNLGLKSKAKSESAEQPKKEYTVEEDFPPETSFADSEDETGWEFMHEKTDQPKQLPQEVGENTSPPDGQENTAMPEEKQAAAKEDDSTEQDRGLKKMLRGFGIGTENRKKRALNEPKAYASFEDYVPREEEQKEKQETDKPDLSGQKDTDEVEQVNGSGSPIGTEDSLEEDDEILYSGDFPSFGQWILNELMMLWIRLNGIGDRQSTATMEDDNEDLGKEVNVANASRYYGSQVTMLRMRFQIGLVLIVILAYLTLGLPVSGMLKTAKVSAAMCLGLQLTLMLLCLDVVTNAAVNLTRRKFGADALAVLACVISSFDALSVAVGGFGNPHIPLCLFSSLALMGILFSSLLSARALRKSIRVPAIGKRVYCVTTEEGVRSNGDLTLLKSVRPTAGFVRRAEESPPDEALFSRNAMVQLLAAILLSFLTALIKHSFGDFLYILSAILSCAVPVTALLAFALPFFIGSGRIFSSGAAVAGWSGIHDIGCSRNLIVTDRDLFPEDTISIETVRIFADDSAERVIGFAGTMIAASGSGLAPCFAELMEKNRCRMRQVEDFQWLSGGGLQGRIEGSTVLCGSSDLMQLMNVKVPYRLVDRTTVLLAIDGVLYGIFKINYVGLPEIRTALQELIASNRHPIFAIRDFNITPDMLHEVFDVATDGYDFPPYGDRFRISEAKPSEMSKISAVVCREGLGPLTHLADTGRSMYVAIRLNLIVTVAVAVFGMLLVFFKLIGTGEVSAWLPFVLMLLDAIIVTLISLFMRF